MPHKRAKRSVREQVRQEKGHDLAPGKQSLSTEGIPKSVARVLNAEKTREEWSAARKRKSEGGGEDGEERKNKNKKRKLGIQPGESMQHFNKRVESDMRPLVRSAVQTSLANARGAAKKEKEKKKKPQLKQRTVSPSPPLPPTSPAKPIKEFAKSSSSAPRRLNDIVQAPPDISVKLKKKPIIEGMGGGRGGSGVLSMAQKVLMEEEREKVIKRYRELKEAKRQQDHT